MSVSVFRTIQAERARGGKEPTPTKAQFSAYDLMFGYFNARLFGGQLPACILNFSRKAHTHGFFAPGRWQRSQGEVRHEISLNPASLRTRPAIEVASTLVHEMVHLWQQDFGKPSRRGYHNAQWAAKMDEVGLVPSSTGGEGGDRVGQHVSHYIQPGGAFAQAFEAMPSKYLLPWSCEEPEEGRRAKPGGSRNKVKYSCGSCGANVWGKPGLTVICGECGETFEEDHP